MKRSRLKHQKAPASGAKGQGPCGLRFAVCGLRFAAASAGFSQSNCFHSNKACRECQELAWFVGTSAIERLLHRLAIASERASGRENENLSTMKTVACWRAARCNDLAHQAAQYRTSFGSVVDKQNWPKTSGSVSQQNVVAV